MMDVRWISGCLWQLEPQLVAEKEGKKTAPNQKFPLSLISTPD